MRIKASHNQILVAVLASAFSSLFLSSSAAMAEAEAQVLATYDWARLSAQGTLAAGQIITDPQLGQVLKLSSAGQQAFTLLTIDSPAISADQFDLRGQIRYEDVQANAYLELAVTTPEGTYPIRTVASGGAAGRITGTSDWRDLIILEILRPQTPRPTRLELRLIFQGAGTVYLSPLRLTQSAQAPGREPTATFLSTDQVPPGLFDRPPTATGPSAEEPQIVRPWWSGRQAGIIGGVGGSIVGLIGASVGALAGAGRARRLVLALVVGMMVLGLLAAVAGVVAVVQDQPYSVFYPLLLGGGLSAAIFGGLLPVVLHRYRNQ